MPPVIPPGIVLTILPFNVSVLAAMANLPAVKVRLLFNVTSLPSVVIFPLWLMVKLFKTLVVPGVVASKNMVRLTAPFNIKLLFEPQERFLVILIPVKGPSNVSVLLPITNLFGVPPKVNVPATVTLPASVLT